jgi:hypothetical protein
MDRVSWGNNIVTTHMQICIKTQNKFLNGYENIEVKRNLHVHYEIYDTTKSDYFGILSLKKIEHKFQDSKFRRVI